MGVVDEQRERAVRGVGLQTQLAGHRARLCLVGGVGLRSAHAYAPFLEASSQFVEQR